MKLKQKYIKCFSKIKNEELIKVGYKFLYEANGVYWFENNQNLTTKFNDNDVLEGCKYSIYIPI